MRAPTRNETKKLIRRPKRLVHVWTSCAPPLRLIGLESRASIESAQTEISGAVIREAAIRSAREVLPGLSSFVRPSSAGSSSVKDSG